MPVLPFRVAAAFLLALAPTIAPAATPDMIATVDTRRPEADRARDADRKPAATLAFTGVASGMKVMDVIPGGGYFTRLFAAAVGPSGHVFAYIPAETLGHGVTPDALRATLAQQGYANVEVGSDPLMQPAPASLANMLDLVFTAQNYHDLHNMPGVDVVGYDRLIYGMLKPGGVYIVIDHVAAAGAGTTDTNTLHRIDPAVVRKEVEAAGFRFAGMTDILANPRDTHMLKVFDPAIRGHTDQFAFKFVKPPR